MNRLNNDYWVMLLIKGAGVIPSQGDPRNCGVLREPEGLAEFQCLVDRFDFLINILEIIF